MDGVPDIEPSPRIEPGHFFDYHFRITNPPGTHMYHSHVNVARQDMLGLLGDFVILDPFEVTINKDYLLLMQTIPEFGLFIAISHIICLITLLMEQVACLLP